MPTAIELRFVLDAFRKTLLVSIYKWKYIHRETHMKMTPIRFAAVTPILALGTLLSTPCAFAHPEKDTPKTTAAQKAPVNLSDIKLPTQDEIRAIQQQMPDMNKMLSGMKTVMKDEGLHESMMGAVEGMRETMGGLDMAKGEDGMPDMNAMMGAMLSIMGDEKTMGAMLESLGAMQEGLTDVLPPESFEPKDKTPASDD